MKKRINILLLLSLITATIAHSQYNTNFMNYSANGRSVSANLDFEASSNGFTSELMNKFLFGGYIDNNLKARASKKIRGLNNFGLLFNYNVSAFLKGTKNVDFYVGIGNQQIVNATFSHDFYNLMLYGNNMYRGQSANLGNCNINALRFQEIKFGAIMHNIDKVGKIGVSVSFLKGEQLFYINTKANSNLYTSASGNELVFNSNFNMALSDTSSKKFTSFNGVGASADIYFETEYKSKIGNKSVLIANVNNLGFIHWLNNSVQYNSSATLKFSGYNITSIADLADSSINKINRDSLLRSLSNAHKENFNVNIPTNLILINKIYFDKAHFVLGTGFRYIYNANYKGYVFIEPEYHYKTHFTFALHTGYGGYSRLNVGLWTMYNQKHFSIRLGSNGLQGFLFPKTAYGESLFFTLTKKLK